MKIVLQSQSQPKGFMKEVIDMKKSQHENPSLFRANIEFNARTSLPPVIALKVRADCAL